MHPASTAVLANGLTLSCTEHGDPSGPAVVFLPGPTDSWLSYQFVLGHMPASVRAVAVSQRGHGDSDKPADGYRVEDLAADVPLLLDALGMAAAILVGHSGSCLVTRRVAIDHPDRVSGLVLEASPATLAGHPGLMAFVENIVTSLEDPIDPEFARSVIVDTSSPEVRPEVVDELVLDLLKVPARVWRQMFGALLHYDDRHELAGIVAPTLLIWGDADTLVDVEHQAELLRRIRGARMLTYPATGHTPRWEDPARFAANVTGFVDQVHRRQPP